MDDNRVSPMEERTLTNAIERAATVASINTELDRNVLLANQLKKASVDPKFAKTASQAFNKRLTVLLFQKTADEHKADSFQLTDADTVYDLVAGAIQPVLAKAAAFTMSIESTLEPIMQKAASFIANPAQRYENRVSMETFEQHLESMMDKYASAFRDLTSLRNRVSRMVDAEAEEVANIFKNAHYDFDFTTAVNLYGDKLKAAIGDKLDKSASFVPTSKFVIKPQKQIFTKVAKLIEDRESLQSITDFMTDYASALQEFCKSAADFSEEYQMKKFAAPTALQYAQDEEKRLTQELQKAMTAGTNSGAWQARANAGADLILGGLAAGTEGTIKSINDVVGASRAALSNARAMYAAGNNVSVSPGDLLDAAFLTKDRYRDRLLAWSDMSADPQMALYPAEQVFQATNRAMDMDTSLERPDQRELLRAQVSQLLAQNNRASTADLAALAATLKALASSRGNAAVEGAKAVGSLSDKTAPEFPLKDMQKIVGEYGKDTTGLHALAESSKKDYDAQMAKLDKIREAENAAKAKRIETLQKSLDTAKGRVYSALSEREKQDVNNNKRLGEMTQAQLDRENQAKIQSGINDTALQIAQLNDASYREALKIWAANGGQGPIPTPPNTPGPGKGTPDGTGEGGKDSNPQKTPPNGPTPTPQPEKEPFKTMSDRYPTDSDAQRWANDVSSEVQKRHETPVDLIGFLSATDVRADGSSTSNGHIEFFAAHPNIVVNSTYDDGTPWQLTGKDLYELMTNPNALREQALEDQTHNKKGGKGK